MNGGVIYVGQMPGKVIINQGCTINDFAVSASQLGSFFYSGSEPQVALVISNSFITCTSIFLSINMVNAIAKQTAVMAGAIYMQNSVPGITSTSNYYSNCYQCSQGGVFYL